MHETDGGSSGIGAARVAEAACVGAVWTPEVLAVGVEVGLVVIGGCTAVSLDTVPSFDRER